MAALTGSTIANTYTELLRMGNATLHATTGYYIKDSADANSALSIATTRVGIGTDAPDATLHIVSAAEGGIADGGENVAQLVVECTGHAGGSAGPHIALLKSGAAMDDDYIGMISFLGDDDVGTSAGDTSVATTYAGILAQILDETESGTTTDGALFFQAVVNDVLTTHMYMGGGKVGIGTAVPSTTLQIGDISGGAESTFFMTDSDRGFKITVGSGTNATLQSTGTTVPLIFQAGTGNDGDYHFTSSGKVGIGTVTPAAKMHIVSSYDTLAWTLGYGMHRHSFDRDIRYAHNADQTVIVQATIGLYIPDGALITLVSAVVKTVTDLGTHKVNITGSSYSGSAADAAVGGTATELLGAGAAGTQSTDSGSATDIDLTQANEVWVNNTINRGGVANNQYIYVLNAGSANGTTDSTAGTLSIAIEWFGID